MGPDIFDSTLQFVPNWNAMTTPDTTPRPKATPKILSQNSNSVWYTDWPVRRSNASSTVSQAASPIVNAGKMMWNEIVKPNCIRDRRSAVGSIGCSLSVSHDGVDTGTASHVGSIMRVRHADASDSGDTQDFSRPLP